MEILISLVVGKLYRLQDPGAFLGLILFEIMSLISWCLKFFIGLSI